MKKVKDLVVTTGTYMKNGEEKKRWRTVGAMMEDDKGGNFIFLDRSFNTAGVPYKDGSESIIVSLFDPKGAADTQTQAPAQADPIDDIPY